MDVAILFESVEEEEHQTYQTLFADHLEGEIIVVSPNPFENENEESKFP